MSIFDDVDNCTIDEAYEILKDKPILGLDIETTRAYGGKYPDEGLDPYTSKIVMVQIGDEEDQVIIDYRDTALGPLGTLLEDESILKVGHNLKFEYKHLMHAEGVEIKNLYDTMIVEQILYNGRFMKFSLKALSERYLNLNMDKGTRLGFLTIGSRPFTKQEIQYGADDITAPLKIRKLQQDRAIRYNLHKCIKLEMSFIPVLGDIELAGMHFNQKKWIELYDLNEKTRAEVKAFLDNFVTTYYKGTEFIESQLDLFDSTVKCNINWSSSKQVIKFFRHLGICPQEVSKVTGKLSYTVNATVLKSKLQTLKLSPEEDKFVKGYLTYKELEQRCTTFGLDFLKYVNPITGRVHSNYKQILNTGRISSSNPNLQNIPSDARYRECFDAPEGKCIVNADYSGQEQIILANKSLAPNLIEFYRKGMGDMHSYVASKIFDRSFNDYIIAKKDKDDGLILSIPQNERLKERQIAKGAGFAINYGGTGYTIAKNLGISEELGDAVYKEYFKAFPGLKSYFDKVQKKALSRGYILIDELTRRKNFFNPPKNGKEVNAVKRIALNFPIQGEAGSITKLASIIFRRKLKKEQLYGIITITNLIHDEINVEAEEDYADLAAKMLEQSMKEAGDYWCKVIPLEASAVVSDHWTH